MPVENQIPVPDPVLQTPGPSADVPFPIPGVSYSGVSRDSMAIDVTAQSTGTVVTAASVISSKSWTVPSSIFTLLGASSDEAVGPRLSSNRTETCSLTSYQIPKIKQRQGYF